MQICVLGGDVRMDHAAASLQKMGYGVERTDRIPGAAQVLVLPVRYSTDGLFISGTKVPLGQAVAGCRTVIGGGVSGLDIPHARVYDYMCDETVVSANARLTAEGAAVLVAGQMDRALYGADLAVVGMGRIATFLCEILHALGAQVTVYARKEQALHKAVRMGARAVSIAGGMPEQIVSAHDAVLNTVPYVLLDQGLLLHSRPGMLYVELASSPGGIDRRAAERYGVRLVDGQGIPGKYAPRSAGELIAVYVDEILRREGEI